jgi:predicted dehydrogenase
MAATLDAEAQLIDRAYTSWKHLIESEAALPADQRLDLTIIALPVETEGLKALAAANHHLILEPAAVPTAEAAEDLVRTVKASGSIFAVAYLHTGYPMVRRAMDLVRTNKLGLIRKVIVEHHVPPTSVGPRSMGALRDLLPAAENLATTITALKPRALCAELVSNPARRADDDATILLRYEANARGLISLSQSSTTDHSLSIRIHATDASLAWRSDRPEELELTSKDAPRRTYTRAGPDAGPLAAEATRFPADLAEGSAAALANIYRGVYEAIRAKREGRARKGLGREFPTLNDATRAARLIEAATESARAGGAWTDT